MKIERSSLMTLGEFAEIHDLTMEVRYVSNKGYVANFKGVSVCRNKVWFPLCESFNTEIQAIIDYSNKISGERLTFGEYLELGYRIVDVPHLLPEWSESGKPEREAR